MLCCFTFYKAVEWSLCLRRYTRAEPAETPEDNRTESNTTNVKKDTSETEDQQVVSSAAEGGAGEHKAEPVSSAAEGGGVSSSSASQADAVELRS